MSFISFIPSNIFIHSIYIELENPPSSTSHDEDIIDPCHRSHWNLATYLPPAASIYFKHIVAEYMLQYKKFRNLRYEQKNIAFNTLNSILESTSGGLNGNKLNQPILDAKQQQQLEVIVNMDEESIEDLVVEDMR